VLAPPPVWIVGAIAVRRTWKAAIANLAGFAAFGALGRCLALRGRLTARLQDQA